MKKQVFFLLISCLVASPSLAQTTYSLNVHLSQPEETRPWINSKDCLDPTSMNLGISWQLTTAWYCLAENQDGDVFLATDATCTSATVEIGKKKDSGVDVIINAGQTSGQFPLDGDSLTLDTIEGLKCDSTNQQDYYFCIKWECKVTNIYGNTTTYTYRGGAKIRFDVKAPSAPEVTTVDPGNLNLKVHWTAPGDDDIASYKIYYQPSGSQEDNWQIKELADPNATSAQITGLTNDQPYDIRITAVDTAGNESEYSTPIKTATPTYVENFFDYYKQESGGKEQGGFCFVATAAYGSYGDAMVLPLRAFRDQVLNQSSVGRSFVDGYYQYGPRWARAIRGSEAHKAFARLMLLPAVGLAQASQVMGFGEWAVLLMALGILGIGFRWLRKHKLSMARQMFMLCLTLGLVAGFSKPANAEEDRFTVSSTALSRFQLQIRLGPYYPAVDQEKGLTEKPFGKIYGGSSELLFELGADYEIWKGFGIVTAGGSFGFVQYSGKGLIQAADGSGLVASSDTTMFNLIPLRLNVGYHFDVLAERLGIPLVPYLYGGLDYYIWWVLDGVGDVPSWQDGNTGKSYDARGGIFGYHAAIGLKFLLDVLDQQSAADLQADVGILNSYLFGEYCWSWVDGFGSGTHFNVGDQTFMFGLMLEF